MSEEEVTVTLCLSPLFIKPEIASCTTFCTNQWCTLTLTTVRWSRLSVAKTMSLAKVENIGLRCISDEGCDF